MDTFLTLRSGINLDETACDPYGPKNQADYEFHLDPYGSPDVPHLCSGRHPVSAVGCAGLSLLGFSQLFRSFFKNRDI